MKKTFKDYLTEAPGDKSVKDWMKIGDPDKLSIEDRASDENLYSTGTSGRYDIKQRGGHINDMKAVLARMRKMELEFDSLASEVVVADMDPSEIANELDGIRKRMTEVITLFSTALSHLGK
jgi:hypothetical protein